MRRAHLNDRLGDPGGSAGEGACARIVLAAVVLLGCPSSEPASPSVDSTSAASTSGSTSSVTPSSTANGTTGSPSSSSADETACGFLGCMDVPDYDRCDVWAQDCPAGQKCMPVSFDGALSWNGTDCRAIADDPVAIGEACTIEDDPFSGRDDCPAGSFCFFADAALQGVCLAFCVGDPNDASCDDACSQCTIASGVTPCLPTCDPRLQDCPDGLVCQDGFGGTLCRRWDADAGGDGVVGDPCAYSGECLPGLECRSACDGAACCTPVCTVGDDAPCDALPGTMCTAAEVTGPCHDLNDLGVCLPT